MVWCPLMIRLSQFFPNLIPSSSRMFVHPHSHSRTALKVLSASPAMLMHAGSLPGNALHLASDIPFYYNRRSYSKMSLLLPLTGLLSQGNAHSNRTAQEEFFQSALPPFRSVDNYLDDDGRLNIFQRYQRWSIHVILHFHKIIKETTSQLSDDYLIVKRNCNSVQNLLYLFPIRKSSQIICLC